MSGRNCCTALPRSYTPEHQPSRAVELCTLDGSVAAVAAVTAVTAGAEGPDSRFTSARTEDLQEIRQLFDDANCVSNSVGLVRRKSRDLQHAYATKHPSVVDLFPKIRNKLARKSRSRSLTMANFLEHTQLQQAKTELKATLTSSRGPDAGGYDNDAPELNDVEAAIKPLDGETAAARGRGTHRSVESQMALGSGETHDQDARLRRSISLSAPRTSSETHKLRRSWSDSPLANGVNPILPQIRLPSFEAAANSKSWRQAVMHSLQISPSIPNLAETDAPHNGSSSVEEQPLKEDTFQPVPKLTHRPSESVSHTGFYKSSLERPWTFSHSAKPSSGSLKPAIGLLREPGRTGRSSSNASIHLQNMRISHHLRSPSQFSHCHFVSTAATPAPSVANTRPQTPEPDVSSLPSSPPETSILEMTEPFESAPAPIPSKPSALRLTESAAAVQCRPTPVQRKPSPIQRALSQISQMSRNGTISLPLRLARQQRQASESGFSTDDVPEEWGNVVKGDDAASSMYSTPLESPRMTPRPSATCLPRPSVATIREHHPESTVIVEASEENVPLTAAPCQSSSSEHLPTAPKAAMPENPSTSNLSQNSNSSKVSRFKEDFDTSMTKKSTKRISIANLFTRSKAKRRSSNIESFDGSSDDFSAEPKRLQRASRLAEKSDASGLLAKALKAHHEEKSALFLDPSKVTPRDKMFRQRSASFCRPRGMSAGSDDSGEGPKTAPLPVQPTASPGWHRRSTSETFLKPEFSMPSFDNAPVSNGLARRSASAGRLKPDFSTSIFSQTLSPGQPSSARVRPRLSVALDPMETTEAGDRSRSPSFQLNDFPALMESQPSTPGTFDASHPTVRYFPDSTPVDIDDPNLNLGAWSRYPSHTREQRTGSASTTDKVKARDFAYDINPMNILEEEDSAEDSPRSKQKRKGKKKKKTGLPKSKSMMMGKEYIRNYVRLIRSPSVEWLTHGKGHRSSISAGGSVEHPELELIPPVFAAYPIMEEEGEDRVSPIKRHKGDIESKHLARSGRDHGPSVATGSGQSKSTYDGSADANIAAAERKRRAASSPDLAREMAGSRASDALSWSRHYESCVYLPRASQSIDRSRHPLDSSEDTPALSNVDSDIPLLIDSMLARSRASSVATAPMIANATVPLIRIKSKKAHHPSVGSVSSIRASSMDLLKTLAEAEKRERTKCLDLMRQKSGASSRHVSGKMEVVETVGRVDSEDADVEMKTTTAVTTYDVQAVTPVIGVTGVVDAVV